MKNKIKYRDSIIIILFSLLIFVLLANLISQFMVTDEKEIYTSIIVSDHVGFDLNSTALTFGMAQPGKSASRILSIENNFDFSNKVNIKIRGNISNFLTVSENDFVLNSGEKKELNFVTVPSKDALFGKYEGFVTITLKRNIKLGKN